MEGGVSRFKIAWSKDTYSLLGRGGWDQESDNGLPDRVWWRGFLHWEGI